ncbi:MAG: hypothetical protein LBJ15_15575 [Comamonas sp.]|jgi:type IV secretory pathway VirB2 component (pilin)|uniref:hypothetical protein n=1 Tax=Comamonas sp. TaxID=34028 RepID=UPI00281E1FC1|nr:hypothetical protein [Comamonas sp.]MDR0215411.1 hypothetical protein [Comamonas sp.]
MPNLTFYISAAMPAEAHLAKLSDDCMQLCTSVLGALPQNVHVIYVAAHAGYGHPVFVDVRHRQELHRTHSVMQRFMQALQGSIQRHIALQARIRCFAYSEFQIYALH